MWSRRPFSLCEWHISELFIYPRVLINIHTGVCLRPFLFQDASSWFLILRRTVHSIARGSLMLSDLIVLIVTLLYTQKTIRIVRLSGELGVSVPLSLLLWRDGESIYCEVWCIIIDGSHFRHLQDWSTSCNMWNLRYRWLIQTDASTVYWWSWTLWILPSRSVAWVDYLLQHR